MHCRNRAKCKTTSLQLPRLGTEQVIHIQGKEMWNVNKMHDSYQESTKSAKPICTKGGPKRADLIEMQLVAHSDTQ